LEKKDYARALHDLNEAIRLDPNNVDAYFNRSLIYLHEGDVSRQMQDLDIAIRLDPKHSKSYSNRGWQFFVRKEYDRALADFSEAIRLNPRDKFSLNNRGLVLMEKGELALAMSDFEAAIRVDPNFSWPHANRAKIEKKLSLGRPDAAGSLAATTTALPTHPETAAAPAPPVRRVALVLGNSAYKRVAALPNPRGDAELVATALRAVGFQSVRLENDLAREKLIDVLRAFGREAESADWAVVYFAGHGIEVGGVNYLIPVDAKLETDRDLQYEGVALEQVLGSVEAARKLRLVILDACRDNPFARQMRRTVASRSIGRGLGRIEPEGGTLVAYAAKHGEVALDGEGTNSPFVTALVKRLPTPGMEINKLFRLVRDDVMAATARKQEPFVYGSLPGEDFFFVAGK
jgi:tetratricopeptide (TPR) repeat protein